MTALGRPGIRMVVSLKLAYKLADDCSMTNSHIALMAFAMVAAGCGSGVVDQDQASIVSVVQASPTTSEPATPDSLSGSTSSEPPAPPDSLASVDTTEPVADPATKQEFGTRPEWLETLCAGGFAEMEDLEQILPEHLKEASTDLTEWLADRQTKALQEVVLPAPDDPMSELFRLLEADCAEDAADYYAADEQALLPPLSQDKLEEQVQILLTTPLEEMFDRLRVRGPGLGAWMPIGVADLTNSTFLGLNDGKEYAYDGVQTFTKTDGVWESTGSDSLRGGWWFLTGTATDDEVLESAVISFVGDEHRLGVPTRHVKVELGEWYVAHVWIDEFGQPRRFESTVPLFDTFLWASTDFLELDPEDVVELPADLRTGTPETGQIGYYKGYLDSSQFGEFEFDHRDRGNGLWSSETSRFVLGGVEIFLRPDPEDPLGVYQVHEIGLTGDSGFSVSSYSGEFERCEVLDWDSDSLEFNATGELTLYEYELEKSNTGRDEVFRASFEFTFTCNVGTPQEWTVSGLYQENATSRR